MKSARYYLSGIDWVMATLDTFNKTRTGIGNHSQLVLELEGRLSGKALFNLLKNKLSSQAFYAGKIKRSKKHLAPYWQKMDQTFVLEDIQEFDLDLAENDSELVSQIIGDMPDVNALTVENLTLEKIALLRAATPFKSEQILLAFDLLFQGTKTLLLMRFDHRMFDARGAEGLLNVLLDLENCSTDENCSNMQQVFPSRSAGLDEWKSRFLSGQVINRFLLSRYRSGLQVGTLCPFSLPETMHHCFAVAHFSADQTERIEENVRQQAGYLMNGVYYLNCAAEGFWNLLPDQTASKDLMVPINVDIRETRFDFSKLFFNQLSFMLFCLKANANRKERLLALKDQFMEQTRNQILHHFKHASTLMRIAPLKLLARFMAWRMKAQPSSFSFSYVGNQAFYQKKVGRHRVLNLYHVPIVPVNPGVGIFFTKFNHQLNMVVSGFDHTLGQEQVNQLRDLIFERLTHES